MISLELDEVINELIQKKTTVKGGSMYGIDLKVICKLHPDQDFGLYGVLKP